MAPTEPGARTRDWFRYGQFPWCARHLDAEAGDIFLREMPDAPVPQFQLAAGRNSKSACFTAYTNLHPRAGRNEASFDEPNIRGATDTFVSLLSV